MSFVLVIDKSLALPNNHVVVGQLSTDTLCHRVVDGKHFKRVPFKGQRIECPDCRKAVTNG